MHQSMRLVTLFLVTIVALIVVAAAPNAWAKKKLPFGEARIFIEYNSTANDLGFHVFLDAEDWQEVGIVNPKGRTIFEVEGKRGFGKLGMTELFFEGAEPSLDEFPLDRLLALFPEGKYIFIGTTVEGKTLISRPTLTVSPEFIESLDSGEHTFEVLAIEKGGNQTITEGSFTKP